MYCDSNRSCVVTKEHGHEMDQFKIGNLVFMTFFPQYLSNNATIKYNKSCTVIAALLLGFVKV